MTKRKTRCVSVRNGCPIFARRCGKARKWIKMPALRQTCFNHVQKDAETILSYLPRRIAGMFFSGNFQNAVIGYMVIGQIRTDDTSVPPSFLNEELRQKFLALPVIPRTHIRSALRILDACAGYEYLKTLISGPAHRIESRIAGFIEENLSGDLSVNALCRAFHLSRSEIYSIFHENFASSVAEYIKARRLEKAASLLQETCLPINKIATLCGIPDYNYFSKQFKNAFGISPTQRRNGKTPEPQSTEKN